MKFIYSNWSDPKSKNWNGIPEGLIFECEAEDILVADKKFKTIYGIGPSDKGGSYILTRIEQ